MTMQIKLLATWAFGRNDYATFRRYASMVDDRVRGVVLS